MASVTRRQRSLAALLGAAAAIGAPALMAGTAAAQGYQQPYDQGPPPGQYAPPPGQYPPPGDPNQYPPQGDPSQYPPQGDPGQYAPQGDPSQYPPPDQYDQGGYDQDQGGPQVTAGFAPPPLPDYDQPPPPGPDFLWQPGYWGWDNYAGDYYWIPGAWVEAPQPGLLWTPAWWGWVNGVFLFHQGYWGAHVGWYGGVAYGFGYGGRGFEGGYWRGGRYFYNSSVTNLANVRFTNVYRAPVTVAPGGRASFNGPGGINVRPTPGDLAFQRQARVAPTAAQLQNARAAMGQPQFRASRNNGAPPVAAVVRPGQFQGPGVIGARSAGPGFRPFTPPSGGQRNGPNGFQPPRGGPGANAPAYPTPGNPPSGVGPGGYQPPRGGPGGNAPAYPPRGSIPPGNGPGGGQPPRFTPPGGQPPAQHSGPPQGNPHPAPPKQPKGDEKHPPQ